MTKRVSKGAKLQVDISGVWTTIAHMEKFDSPDAEVQEVGTPTLDQTGAGIPHDTTGFVEPGGSSADLYADPQLAVHQELWLELKTPTQGGRNFRVMWSEGSTWPFSAIVTKFPISAETGNFLKGTLELQLTDLIDWPFS